MQAIWDQQNAYVHSHETVPNIDMIGKQMNYNCLLHII